MHITNKQNLPEGLVRAVSCDPHNESGCISATTLLQGVKQIILTQRHWDQLNDDVSDRIWAVFGTAVHALLETEGEHDFTEIKMTHKVSSITVTGRIDNYNIKDGVIDDYKTTTSYKIKSGDFEDWYMQGMIYAWLVQKNGLPATRCRFIAMIKDHSKTEALRDSSYPQSPVYVYEFSVTPNGIKEIESFIMKKVFQYELSSATSDDNIQPCSEKERWARQDVFAVMKKGRKKSVKNCSTKSEAEKRIAELGKEYYLDVRQGQSIKCKHYCLCCAFCNYYQNNVALFKDKEEELAAA
ncbi:MAG: DUF2188 domain-containing protein [Treponemataceae bacterium]